MITGEIKSKVDRIWDTLWSGGISNPLTVYSLDMVLKVADRIELMLTGGKKPDRERYLTDGNDSQSLLL